MPEREFHHSLSEEEKKDNEESKQSRKQRVRKRIGEMEPASAEATSKKLHRLVETVSIPTNRSLEEYCNELNIQPEDLRDKIILDVGSGVKERFSKEAEGYEATVVSIDPKFKHWLARKQLRGFLRKDRKWQKRSVAGRAQELPFKERNFDMVTAMYSVPYYLYSEKDILKAVQEMTRVLKPGGKLYIAPREEWQELKRKIKTTDVLGAQTMEWLDQNNFNVAPGDTGPIIITKEDIEEITT